MAAGLEHAKPHYLRSRAQVTKNRLVQNVSQFLLVSFANLAAPLLDTHVILELSKNLPPTSHRSNNPALNPESYDPERTESDPDEEEELIDVAQDEEEDDYGEEDDEYGEEDDGNTVTGGGGRRKKKKTTSRKLWKQTVSSSLLMTLSIGGRCNHKTCGQLRDQEVDFCRLKAKRAIQD